jgi:quaternary ammonium compound-resistance protein SugE
MSSPWFLLFIAGLLEVCWAVGLKYTNGFSRLVPSLFTLATLAGSMFFLANAAKTLPIGTAYAVWVGIGAAGTAVLGMFLFNEPVTLARIGFISLLVISIMGLKYSANH